MDKKWWTLLAVCAGTFMLLVDVTIVNVALPDIQSGLHASFSDVQWVVDAYALTLASLLLTSGVFADMYGRRLLFGIGLTIFTVGSLLCGLAQNPLMLILSRSGQGVGGAIMFSTALALLAQSFHGKERGTAFAAWGAVTGLAAALGPILGGVLTSGISWRAIFLVNVPVGIVTVIIVLARIEESKAPHVERPDWPGFASLTCALVALVYGLIRASESSWTSASVLVLLALGIALLAVFVVVERNVAHPMFDLSLFRTPTFVGGSIAAFGMNSTLFAMMLYLVLYLQDVLGYSALQTGLRLLVVSGAMFVTATLAGRLSSHLPVRWMIGVGLILVGIGLAWMSGLSASSRWTHLLGGFIVSGLGAGMVNPPLASTAVGVVEPQRSGMASGVNTTFRQIGIATSIAGLGSLFAFRLTSHLRTELAGIPGLAGHASSVSSSVRSGNAAQVINSVPAGQRGAVGHAITASFVSGMNEILIVAAGVAAVTGIASIALIRGRDFVHSQAPAQAARAEGGETAPGSAVPSQAPA